MHEAETLSGRSQVARLTARLTDPTLETAFLEARHRTDLRRIRWAIGLAALVNLIFALLDWMVIEQNQTAALALRMLMGPVGSALALLALRIPGVERHPAPFGLAVFMSVTLIYGGQNAIADTPDEYLSGFMLVLMFLFFLIQIDFAQSVAIGLLGTIIFSAMIPLTRQIGTGELLTIYAQFTVTLLAGGFASWQVNTLRRLAYLDQRRIDEQRRQYFDLLTRILPAPIVARIEAGETRIADDVPQAVVLFADVVGFTEMAARHEADAVVHTLDTLFARFDRLVADQGLEKIKTIGDAYMVAGGVPVPGDDIVAKSADLALRMVTAARDCRGPGGEPLDIRIGLHMGPVLAGMIGETRFTYDLWGDTVNLSSRLQGAARPGTICISDTMRAALGPGYRYHPIGLIDLKGVGKTQVTELRGHAAG